MSKDKAAVSFPFSELNLFLSMPKKECNCKPIVRKRSGSLVIIPKTPLFELSISNESSIMKTRLQEVQKVVDSVLTQRYRITTIVGSCGLMKSNFVKFVA